MPNVVYAEPTPVWVATNDPALPWRVQTSQYTAEMADYLDAGAHPGGMLWRFTHHSGRITKFAPEAFAYIDHLLRFDPFWSLDHIQAVVSGDTITYDHPQYRVTYQALHDRLKLTMLLKVACRAPNPDLVTEATAFLTLTGGIELPADLEVWDRTGKRVGDFSTRGEVYLKDASGSVVQFLDRVTARDSEGHPGAGELRLATDADGTRRLYQGMAWGWLQVATYEPTEAFPEGGVEIDPTVATATSQTGTAYPNQRKVARFNGDANGVGKNVLFGVFMDSAGNVQTSYSTDGTTWAAAVSLGIVVTSCSGFIDPQDYIHLVMSVSGGITYRRGTPNAARTTYTWTTGATLSNTGSDNYPDIVAHPEGTGWKAHAVWSHMTGTTNQTIYQRIDISGGNVIALDGATLIIGGTYGVAAHTFPSITLDGSKSLYVTSNTGATGAGKGVRGRRALYSAATWPWDSEQPITESVYASSMGPCLFDSQGRVVVAFRDSSANGYVRVFRRDAQVGAWSDISPTTLAGTDATIAIDLLDKLYLWYTTGSTLERRINSGSGAVWSAATTVMNVGGDFASKPSARRGATGGAVDVFCTMGNPTNGYRVQHDRLIVNQAPTKPTNISVPNFDATGTQRGTYLHNDPDGNPQTAQQLQFVRVDTGATVLDTGKVATANQYYDIAANAMPQNKQFQVRVMTWDSFDAASPWSDYATFYTSARPTVVITTPATDGTVVSSSSLTADGTTSDPESEGSSAYQFTLTDNSDGVLWDSGKVASTAPPRQTIGYSLANGGAYKVKLTGWDAKNVPSVQGVRTFTVSYTPPAASVPSVTPDPSHFPPRVTIKAPTPAPVGSQPNVSTNRFERRVAGSSDPWKALGTTGPNGTLDDLSGASGTFYEYRVVAVGDNQTESASTPVTAGISRSCWWFIPISDPSKSIPFAFDRQADITDDRAFAEVDTRGRYTVTGIGGKKRATINITATFPGPQWGSPHDGVSLTEEGWRQRFADVALTTQGYIHNPKGLVMRGILQPARTQDVINMVTNPYVIAVVFVEKGAV